MNHFFLGNQMIRLFNQIKQSMYTASPFIQSLIRRSVLDKCDETRWSVHTSIDGLAHDQFGKEFFSFFGRKIQERLQSCKRDLGVVFGDDTNVLEI